MSKEEILKILETAKDENGNIPMRLVRQAFEKLPEPCEDAVSREALKENSFNVFTKDYGYVDVVGCDTIDNLPSVTPKRKTGEWNFIGDNMFECTSCGVVYTTGQLNSLRNYDSDPYAPKFCPNCGSYNGGK